jgi:ATP-dependent exoDNAse (exonuclease V) beta subunit
MPRLNRSAQEFSNPDRRAARNRGPGIKILTVASSRGLQFRTVILIFAGKFALNLRW